MSELNPLTPEQKKENRTLLGALGLIVIAVAALAIIGFLFLNKPADGRSSRGHLSEGFRQTARPRGGLLCQ